MGAGSSAITDLQKDLVRSSWAQIQPRALRFVDLLYEELFSAEPQLRILFEGPMDEQHHKLVDVIQRAVDGLDDPTVLRGELQALGHRHDDYGVEPHHFIALGNALERALLRMLQKEFTPEVRDAWAAFYDLLSTGMQRR